MNYTLFNIGSVILGFASFIFPIVSVAAARKENHNLSGILSFSGYASAILTLFFQIIYQNHLVDIKDWSALMDTSSALVLVAGLYIAALLIVNVLSLNTIQKLKSGK